MRALALIALLLGCNARLGLGDRPDTGAGGAGGDGTGGSSSAGVEAAGGAVSTSAGDDDTCAMTRQLQLSDPRVADADGDGLVEPGDDITLTVTLSNPGPLDHNWYPGVQIVSNDAGVTELGYGDWLYALLAHTSAALSTRFHVDDSMLPGTVVRFLLSAAALNVRCPGVATLEYSILIQ